MARRLLLVNPNSDAESTRTMWEVACECAAGAVQIEAATSARAAPVILDPVSLHDAEERLLELFEAGLDPLDGVIVAAFGDPGVSTLRARLPVPVMGIGEAALREAAAIGGFTVCTTTPDLAGSIRARAQALGLGADLLSVRTTRGDPRVLMKDSQRLDTALAAEIHRAVHEDGARAVVIGGGPLARSARRLAPDSPVPLVEPVPAAVRYMIGRWPR